MTEPTNDTRASWASIGLCAYVKMKAERFDADTDEAWLQDLLTDLRHMADRKDLDFDRLNVAAGRMHAMEVEEETAAVAALDARRARATG